MKKNIFNVTIIIVLLFLFRFAEATGAYSAIVIEEQQEEAFSALFYQILSASMAEKGTAKEYTKEEMGDLEEGSVLCYDDELLSGLWISTEDLENRPDYGL